MTCRTLPMPGGGHAIVCSRGPAPRVRRCACEAPAEYLCDWPTGKHGTCSAPICDACRKSIAADIDYCPTHAHQRERQLAAGVPTPHG